MAIAELSGSPGALGAGELGGDAAAPGGGASAAGRLPAGASAVGSKASAALDGAAALPEQGSPYPAMPERTGYAPRALAFTGAARGYASAQGATAPAIAAKTSAARTATTAKKTSSSKSTSSKTSSTAKTTSKTTSAELAFLSDPRLSIEDKLFQFMALMQQKSDRELVDAMKQYEGKKASSAAKSTSSSGGASTGKSSGAGDEKKTSGGGGGGLFGMLGDALGGIAKTVVGGAEALAKDLGGPLLAAGCTAVGLPFLAPVALEVGGTLAKSAVGGLASAVGLDELGGAGKSSPSTGARRTASGSSSASKASSSSRTTSSSSAATDGGELDEKLEMMKLQRLVEKQSTMFAALSNVLKALHESQMSAVNNIR